MPASRWQNRRLRLYHVAMSGFLKRVWRLTLPYWRSEERWRARVLLAVIVIISLALVFLLVLFNDWNREFYEAIQNKDAASFGPLLLRFCVLAALYILGAVYKLYYTQMLEMRWRVWLTRRFLGNWLDDQAYYRMEIQDRRSNDIPAAGAPIPPVNGAAGATAAGITDGTRRSDNPDQRIADDIQLFTSNTLGLSLGLLSSVVTLASFITILWAVSGPLTLALGGTPVTIPGYMVWAAVLYSLVGSVLTHVIGRPLIPLNFQQQRLEADFRFGLVRVRENAEGIALYHGEASEGQALNARLGRIRANWWQLMRFTKRLTFFTVGYEQLAVVFPVLVAAPRYFADEISLGVLVQIANAFGQVQGSLSWFVGSYGSLASWRATVDRLLTFQQAVEQPGALAGVVPATAAVTKAGVGLGPATAGATVSPAAAGAGIQVVPNGAAGDAVRAEHVQLGLPNGRVVLTDASFSIQKGDRVLLTGPTGAGKSTLFRAVAGIWPFG
ncbi:MAG TPA: SbmA/BacA-like family transporter, partial [Chloroflexota bacterium]|nr:SbmA/BacA-like family transporter [Chloroflexota bacterium]